MMTSFYQSKRSANKHCTVEGRWGIFVDENLTVVLPPKSGRKYYNTNSYIFGLTLITHMIISLELGPPVLSSNLLCQFQMASN